MGNVSPIVSLQFQWRRYFELTLQGDFVKNNKLAIIHDMHLKRIILSSLLLSLWLVSARAREVLPIYPNVVNSNRVMVALPPEGEAPEWMAVVIQTDDQINTNTNFDNVRWLPFKTNLLVDLGPGDGERVLLFSFRYKGQARSDMWGGGGITVQTGLPLIGITNPKQKITSQPVVQFQGYCNKPLGSIHYDLLNENGIKTISNEDGYANDQYNFICYDVQLSPGTNTFVVRCADEAGNLTTTNFVVVFTTAGATNPPVINLQWPQDGWSISGSQFNLIGRCDDFTANVTAFVNNDEGKSTMLEGVGYFRVDRIPLAEAKSYITVVVTDAAQNSSLTNLTVTKSHVIFTVDPPKNISVTSMSVTVSGFCSRTNGTVEVNGVKAKMNPDGHWVANDVPNNTFRYDATCTGGDDDEPPTISWLPTICSEPTNSLSAGISLVPAGTNEYNHYSIYLGVTNTSGRNIPNTWMLPRDDARFSLRLYDKNNQEIAKQENIQKSGQTLPDNLSIHHLGKNELTSIDGIISLSTNSTARIASLKLDEHFQLPPPGKYRLEIVATLFRIADDGRLIPFEFPPVSTVIQIIDQPSEMVYYLNDLQRQGKLVWGSELNSLRIGVAYGLDERSQNIANQIEIFLQNFSTNDFRNLNLRLPDPNEQFDVSLYDTSGKEVPKTALGRQQGQPLSLDGQNSRKPPGFMDDIKAFFGTGNVRRIRGFRPVFLPPKDAIEYGRFNLNDYFEIKSVGKYRLIYQQRFYQWNTNSTPTSITMPMVTLPLEIHSISGQ
jgi:hypothetical protein